MVTTMTVAGAASAAASSCAHDHLRELLAEANRLPHRDCLHEVLWLVERAADTGTLTPDVAFTLGQQLRIVTGDAPATEDLEGHLLLEALLSELIELTSVVDGVHVDDLEPLVEHLLATGQVDEARRTARRADAARARVRVLERSLAADLGAA